MMQTYKQPGRYAYDGIDRVIHEKARLSIVASLASHADGLLFNELKEVCALTDGNLSRHLSILQDAAVVEVWKRQRNNRSQTLVRLTADGRKRFLDYLAQLEQVISDANKSASANSYPGELKAQTAL
jgi:DNA-binding transcriptional ArsR family regulator